MKSYTEYRVLCKYDCCEKIFTDRGLAQAERSRRDWASAGVYRNSYSSSYSTHAACGPHKVQERRVTFGDWKQVK